MMAGLPSLMVAPTIPAGLLLRDARQLVKRPRKGGRDVAAKRLVDALGQLAGNRWKRATRGQRLPTGPQAAALMRQVKAAVIVANGLPGGGRLREEDVFNAARQAVKDGMAAAVGTENVRRYGVHETPQPARAFAERAADGSIVVVLAREGARPVTVAAPARHLATLRGQTGERGRLLLSGDFVAVETSPGRFRRYDADGKLNGVAIPIPVEHPIRQRYAEEFEHAQTFDGCTAELAHKVGRMQAQDREDARRAAEREMSMKDRARLERAIQRFARLSISEVRYDDVRTAGACDAGIRQWCQEHGRNPDAEAMPLRDLAADPEARGYALRIAKQRLAEAREARKLERAAAASGATSQPLTQTQPMTEVANNG